MAILDAFDEQMLPWSGDDAPRLVPTGRIIPGDALPAGVLLTKKKLRGPRRALVGRRDLEHIRAIIAEWPREGLIENNSLLLICVLKGRVDFRAGETVAHCGEGHFLLLPPGLPHDGARSHYDCDPQNTTPHDFCDLLWFARYGRIIRSWTCHCQGATHGSRPGEQADFLNEAANQLLDLLFEETMGRPAGWQTLGGQYLHSFLTALRRDLSEGNTLRLKSGQSPDAESLMAVDELHSDPVGQVQRYIRTHLREALTIDGVARHFYMSRSQFTRWFRKSTGQTFAEYLTACRLEEAKSLLCESTLSSRRIARYVGLRSPSYFSQLFTRSTGLTPQQFRETAPEAPKNKF